MDDCVGELRIGRNEILREKSAVSKQSSTDGTRRCWQRRQARSGGTVACIQRGCNRLVIPVRNVGLVRRTVAQMHGTGLQNAANHRSNRSESGNSGVEVQPL